MNHISSCKNAMKVLIVEDSYFNQSILMEILDSLGLKYDLAKNGKEAIAMVKRYQYNIIFMDVNMPKQDGLSASKEIRHELKIYTPIVIMTASKIFDAFDEMDHFIDAYIEKPLNKIKVKKIIEEFSIQIENMSHEPEEEMIIDFGRLDRIDTVKGLSFSGNSLEIYINTLYSFVKNFKDLLEIDERQYLEEVEKTQRLFHTLKGASLGIGAMDLSILSEYVEKTVAGESYGNKASVINKCLQELKLVIDVIETFLNKIQKKSYSKKRMLSLLDLVVDQIKKNDDHSYENFITLKDELSSRKDLYMTLERIKLQLEMCDFQDALISVGILKDKF